MKEILEYLFEHKKLERSEAKQILVDMAQGKYNEHQAASFLTVFAMRGIEPEELAGFVAAMQDLCVKVDLSDFETIDMCGTGGDNKNTFNISTLASFVVAGAGIKVAKHGNYSVSSHCGSSNVLESLGYSFSNDPSVLKKSLEGAGICFLHAPLFHPAMKNIAPIRRALGYKTFFNMLGPLSNPSNPQMQSVGVFSLEVARLYKYILEDSGKRFSILYSMDGYDEVSLTGPFKLISNRREQVLSPEDVGFKQNAQQDIYGGESIDDAVRIFKTILEGNGTEAQVNTVVCNAAMGILCAKPEQSIADCIAEARESLERGNALRCLKTLLSQ